ncbi:DNA (cytosine-5-)-methyltransferase [Candidatus Bipolaricaulota bacterium]
MRKRAMRFVDMFAGLGGFHMALSRLGHECVMACESNDALRALYARNFGIQPHPDIRSLRIEEVPSHDILCAGFPCQPFSKAGEQLGMSCLKDGDLFDELVRIVEGKRPGYLILENVANLEKHDQGRTYRAMRGVLEDLGYIVDQRVISPHIFGIPQKRDRLFIVACLHGLDAFRWPEANGEVPSINDILDDEPTGGKPIPDHFEKALEVWQEFIETFPVDEQLPYFPIWGMEFGADYPFRDKTPASITSRSLARYRGTLGLPLRSLQASERLEGVPSYARASVFPPWKQRFIELNRELYARHRDWIDPWRVKLSQFSSSLQKLEWNCKGEPRQLDRFILQFRASGIRVKRPNVAPSLIAMTSTQVPVVASRKRYLTVRECSRLQGMEELRFLPESPTPAYRALGNAVNVDVVEKVAEGLLSRVC